MWGGVRVVGRVGWEAGERADGLPVAGDAVLVGKGEGQGQGGRLGGAVACDEDVVRVDGAVDQPFALGVLEAEGDFLRNPADTREDSSNSPKVPTDKFALRFVKPR